ncbi:PEP-CTERM sorting domain-containing protein [Nostoc sp. CALU 546]|uniref:PEP-CTERM sorting domain-containing protein n=1 Tax=Nostoc sp. CALU 546 TaxID=1867241 RepID=UPI003B66BEE6
MIKNNRKKAVAQAISTAVALGWVIMQVESAQAATLTVNNLNDSGVGSLRDTINIATSNDVVEFLLGSNPSTITLTSGALAIAKNLTINGPGANLLTISGNNQFPVFDINAADVTLSGLAIAGNINGYDSSNLTLINSTVTSDDVKINNSTGNVTFINSTINGNNSVEINTSGLTVNNGTNVTAPTNNGTAGQINVGGNILVIGDSITIGNSGQINGGDNNSAPGGGITVGNSGEINSGSNNGGSITITTGNLIVTTRVPEPSAIAGTILAGSLAWLAKRKQAAFRKTKV